MITKCETNIQNDRQTYTAVVELMFRKMKVVKTIWKEPIKPMIQKPARYEIEIVDSDLIRCLLGLLLAKLVSGESFGFK